MNWDLSVAWTRTTRTQTQIQEHKPKNYFKKKKKKLIKARNSDLKANPQQPKPRKSTHSHKRKTQARSVRSGGRKKKKMKGRREIGPGQARSALGRRDRLWAGEIGEVGTRLHSHQPHSLRLLHHFVLLCRPLFHSVVVVSNGEGRYGS